MSGRPTRFWYQTLQRVSSSANYYTQLGGCHGFTSNIWQKAFTGNLRRCLMSKIWRQFGQQARCTRNFEEATFTTKHADKIVTINMMQTTPPKTQPTNETSLFWSRGCKSLVRNRRHSIRCEKNCTRTSFVTRSGETTSAGRLFHTLIAAEKKLYLNALMDPDGRKWRNTWRTCCEINP